MSGQPAEWYRRKREQRGAAGVPRHIWGRLIAKHQNYNSFRWKKAYRASPFYPGVHGDTYDHGPGSFVFRIELKRAAR